MPKPGGWRQKAKGQPKRDDPRWNSNQGDIYEHIHVKRRRAWVKWRPLSDYGSRYLGTIGLVVRPLDTYCNIDAFIPYEDQINDRPAGVQREV